MSDYDDDFENDNDDFNDRDHKTVKRSKKSAKKSKKAAKNNSPGIGYKGGHYDTQNSNLDTLARDNTIGIKPRTIKKPSSDFPIVSETPNAMKSKQNILNNPVKPRPLAKQGGVYSSTPNLQNQNREQKRSLLGGEKTSGNRQSLKMFGLTKKAQQTIIPSKGMILDQAEKLIEDAKNNIDKFKSDRDRTSGGNIDEKLEVAIKENKYLQKTLIDMQNIINSVFEKYDPVKAPMKSYPQTERIKSPPKSVQMKYRTKEVENAQHALDNMMAEYEKVHARMELIKDPNFFSNLHLQLDDINKQMKELEKENKSLLTEQKKREVEMEKLISQGAPDTMFQINDLQNKVTITKDQLRKEQSENDEVDALMQQVLEQEKVLKEKEAKLKEIGMKYDLNFDTDNNDKNGMINGHAYLNQSKQLEAEKLQTKRETYEKHLAIAESATKSMQKKLKTTSKINKAKLKELEAQRQQYEKELEEKTELVKEKNKEIAELMERNAKLIKRQTKESNDFFIAEKAGNGYDAVQKAIEEQNEKETQAVIIIQAWCRMILATRFVNRLKHEMEEMRMLEKEVQELEAAESKKHDAKNSKMVDSSTGYETEVKGNKRKQKVPNSPKADDQKPSKVDNQPSRRNRNPEQTDQEDKITSKPSLKPKKSEKNLPQKDDNLISMVENTIKNAKAQAQRPKFESKPKFEDPIGKLLHDNFNS